MLDCGSTSNEAIEFLNDKNIFSKKIVLIKKYAFKTAYLDKMIWNYCYLNRGLSIYLNGQRFQSKDGLKDLLTNNMDGDSLFPIIHLEGNDIEVAITHGSNYGEEN